ncbi:MAG TPA: SWIM zinc finger family protein, partial [Kofleriaceae bacterium]
MSEPRARALRVSGPLSTRASMAFDPATQSRGLTYARGGHVLGLAVHGRTAEARVLGTRSAPYLVTVACPVSTPERLRTSCSCPMGTDRIPCKHVYAVLQQLDLRRVDLGAEGRALQVETLDPAEAQRSLGISSERTPKAMRAGARDEGGVEDDGVEDHGDEGGDSGDSDGVGDLDDEDDEDDEGDEDLGPRRSAARSLAVTQVVAPRRAIAARGGRGADADWRSRLGWIQQVPAPALAPRVPSEIEIVLA